MSSSLASQLPSRLSLLSSPAATSTVVTDSAKQLAWKAAVYLVLALAVTSFISGTILLIWNDDWTALVLRRLKLESALSASTLVQWMLCYFTTLFPVFQRLGRAAAAPRPQPVIPLFRRPRLRQPLLAEPPLAVFRDSSTFRAPPDSYSSSEPSTLPSFSAFLYSAGPVP